MTVRSSASYHMTQNDFSQSFQTCRYTWECTNNVYGDCLEDFALKMGIGLRSALHVTTFFNCRRMTSVIYLIFVTSCLLQRVTSCRTEDSSLWQVTSDYLPVHLGFDLRIEHAKPELSEKFCYAKADWTIFRTEMLTLNDEILLLPMTTIQDSRQRLSFCRMLLQMR